MARHKTRHGPDRLAACEGKERFDSYTHATAHRTRAGDAYRCPFCGFWHRTIAKGKLRGVSSR